MSENRGCCVSVFQRNWVTLKDYAEGYCQPQEDIKRGLINAIKVFKSENKPISNSSSPSKYLSALIDKYAEVFGCTQHKSEANGVQQLFLQRCLSQTLVSTSTEVSEMQNRITAESTQVPGMREKLAPPRTELQTSSRETSSAIEFAHASFVTEQATRYLD
ncbi:hypothetical protein AV530_015556 [Patagioenas fasciata monilis]|uniref:Uncharacterized protein n=1 Tax=Patagioenas fasciata monilis TaxID=372326 RepID=A0A1V4KHW8_PATFA|nr:hypothetical protein AV530_015556 [Patagioenas fasciata monilis]